MKFFDIPEIKNAKALLKRSENEIPLISFIDLANQALEIINEYIENNPTYCDINKINNMKISYIRSILKKIILIDGNLEKTRTILGRFVKDDVQRIVFNDKISKKYFDDFVKNKWEKSLEFKQIRERLNLDYKNGWR
jgi:hypothetical protein